MSDPLPAELEAGLRRSASARGTLGLRTLYFAETGSTNDVAARAAEHGEPAGTLVIAGAQTAGRGRFGRQWHSPPGAGLYVSAILRDVTIAPYITLAAGVGLAEGIRRATALPVEIKWPNDIVAVGGRAFRQRRKLAGILAEAASDSRGVQHIILGFGINLRAAAFPPDLADRATSIESELGRPCDPGEVLGSVLAGVHEAFEEVRAGRVEAMLSRWRSLAPSIVGESIEWDSPAGVRSGTTAGLGSDGTLLVQAGQGVEAIRSGEIRWK